MNTLLSERSVHVLLISKSPDDGQTFKTLFDRFSYPHPPVLHVQETVEGGKRILDVYDTDIVIFASNVGEESVKEGLNHLQQSSLQLGTILLGPDSFLKPNSLSYWGVHVYLSRSELTAPHLAHSLLWTLEKVALEERIQALQQEHHAYHWEIDTSQNRWKQDPSLIRFMGKPLDTLDQYLYQVPAADQQKVAMAFMKGIRNREKFEIEHLLNTEEGQKNIRLSGGPNLSKEGKLTSLSGKLEVLPATPPKVTEREIRKAEESPIVPQKEPEPKPVVADPTPSSVYQNGGNGSQRAATSTPVQIRYTNIAYLKQVSSGDKEIMRKAISKFLETTPEMITQLETQLKSQDYDQLGKTAHKLKSSVGLMGMEELQKTMQNIELVAKSKQRLDVLPVLVDRSQKMLTHSLTELEQEMKAL
ncbi:MAG: Hpt domain-containing protein [Bacteroidota bacterium]